MRCYYGAWDSDQEFFDALKDGARRCHAELLRQGEEDLAYAGMATTLTLYLGVWPRAYLLQVGDSRCYLLRDGELAQITRDQTMAQHMMDLGVMNKQEVAGTRFEHLLTSSIGGQADRAHGDPGGHDLGPRPAALQRWAHQSRAR